MAIKVLNPGAITTVQDEGRFGYQQFGMSCSGVMDLAAYRTANRLLGNTGTEAVLEYTLFGGIYSFDQDTVIALTGADMNPTLGKVPVSMNRPIRVKAGETLCLSTAASGCRTYLGVQGGILVPKVMGSRSTNIKCGIGGFCGRRLQAGDILKTAEPDYSLIPSSFYDLPEHPVYPSHVSLRVIEGPQADYFSEEEKHTFYSSSYTVSAESDRMGCRLNGPTVKSLHGTDIISDGIVFGSIQITSSGQPIIMTADRQTTGGYAKIATVCSFDLPALAQCRPGASVCFQRIRLEDL